MQNNKQKVNKMMPVVVAVQQSGIFPLSVLVQVANTIALPIPLLTLVHNNYVLLIANSDFTFRHLATQWD